MQEEGAPVEMVLRLSTPRDLETSRGQDAVMAWRNQVQAHAAPALCAAAQVQKAAG